MLSLKTGGAMSQVCTRSREHFFMSGSFLALAAISASMSTRSSFAIVCGVSLSFVVTYLLKRKKGLYLRLYLRPFYGSVQLCYCAGRPVVLCVAYCHLKKKNYSFIVSLVFVLANHRFFCFCHIEGTHAAHAGRYLRFYLRLFQAPLRLF